MRRLLAEGCDRDCRVLRFLLGSLHSANWSDEIIESEGSGLGNLLGARWRAQILRLILAVIGGGGLGPRLPKRALRVGKALGTNRVAG